MQTLLEQIQALSSERAIEAASTFSNIVTAGNEDPDASNLVRTVEQNPYRHLGELEELSRLVLINGAEKEEYHDIVQEVVNKSGQKQLILGGAEIVALAVVAVAALKIILNPATEEDIEITDAKGNKTKIKKKYSSDTGFLPTIMKSFFKK